MLSGSATRQDVDRLGHRPIARRQHRVEWLDYSDKAGIDPLAAISVERIAGDAPMDSDLLGTLEDIPSSHQALTMSASRGHAALVGVSSRACHLPCSALVRSEAIHIDGRLTQRRTQIFRDVLPDHRERSRTDQRLGAGVRRQLQIE